MKSRVRVWVTYGAALYVFLFGAILCGLLLWLGSDATGMAEAKDLFLATLPIGSGILAYWFAAAVGVVRETTVMTIRRRTQSANSADQNGPVLTPNNWSLIRVRDACQSYPMEWTPPPGGIDVPRWY